MTCNNFVNLCNNNFKNMRFHYVRREFLIASGDYIDGIFY